MMNISISWGAANNSWLLIVATVIGLLILYRNKRARTAARLLCVPEHFSRFLPRFSVGKQLIKLILMLLGIGFMILALMRPQRPREDVIISQEARDLLVAVDISRSMLAQDRKPDRLSFAKEKINRLLNMLDSERVGLLVFSGSTFMQCPLTSDVSAFKMYLDQLDVETISSGTTALDAAIQKALNVYKQMPDRKNKLLVIFTDGEDFSSNLSSVKQQAAQAGMHIFTIGLGTLQGAPIPLFDAHGNQVGHQKDKKGNVVISRLNEGILRNLAADSGGEYVKATDDDSDLRQLVSMIKKFEKEAIEDKKIAQFEQLYHYSLIGSFICFALEWLL